MLDGTCGTCLSVVARGRVAVLSCPAANLASDELDPLKPVSGVGEGAGQLRPYVRPVARRLPLAIMGMRVRVRRQSGGRARCTRLLTASPKTAFTQPFPSRCSALAAGSNGLVPAVYARARITPLLPQPARHRPSHGRP